VDKYGLRPHIRFGSEVAEARFDERAAAWHLSGSDGVSTTADLLVCATGQLSRPLIPEIPGLSDFPGACFHSARWDHCCDLRGKRVAVIGNAASAVQCIPEIAPLCERLLVFQRSANWCIRKRDRDYSELEKRLASRFPLLLRYHRLLTWLRGELLLYPLMTGNVKAQERAQKQTLHYLEESIDDPALRKQLVPDYPIGAKRILFTDNYYQALNRGDVDVLSAPIERISSEGVVTRDGTRHAVDVIILATGFRSDEFLAPLKIEGRQGAGLDDVWRNGAEAFLGMSISGFPNLFLMYGPNTNLGHNSIVVMSECQARYIVSCVRQMRRHGIQTVDVKASVEARYNEEMQRRLRQMSWNAVTESWYKRHGRITNNWPGRTTEYWRRTRRCDLADYDVDRSATAMQGLVVPEAAA